VIALSTLIGLLAQALPWFNQVNGEPLALVAPVNFAMALAMWHYARSSPARPAVEPAKPRKSKRS
jgi:hypothetical protein